jgi:hypothetical protein
MNGGATTTTTAPASDGKALSSQSQRNPTPSNKQHERASTPEQRISIDTLDEEAADGIELAIKQSGVGRDSYYPASPTQSSFYPASPVNLLGVERDDNGRAVILLDD